MHKATCTVAHDVTKASVAEEIQGRREDDLAVFQGNRSIDRGVDRHHAQSLRLSARNINVGFVLEQQVGVDYQPGVFLTVDGFTGSARSVIHRANFDFSLADSAQPGQVGNGVFKRGFAIEVFKRHENDVTGAVNECLAVRGIAYGRDAQLLRTFTTIEVGIVVIGQQQIWVDAQIGVFMRIANDFAHNRGRVGHRTQCNFHHAHRAVSTSILHDVLNRVSDAV